MRTTDPADVAALKKLLPPGVTQEMIDASLAANPSASKGGYEGVGVTPAASETPASSGDSPIPGVDPFRLAQANDAYSRAVASVGSRRGATLTQYGFKANGYDDQGNPLGLEVDPMSQYGLYQQMLQQQSQDAMTADEDSAARGFTGGLANQASSRLRYQTGADSLKLGSGLLGTLGGYSQELLGAKKGYDDELWQARLDAARTAVDNGDWTPTATTPDNPNSNTFTPPVVKPPTSAAPKKAAALAKSVLSAKKVTANKTGATVQKGRGVISIH